MLELLVVVTLLGIIAVVIVPRLTTSTDFAKTNLDLQMRSDINTAAEQWYIEKGFWPAADLSDIGADPDYFPSGIPDNPLGGTYSLNSDHRVE